MIIDQLTMTVKTAGFKISKIRCVEIVETVERAQCPRGVRIGGRGPGDHHIRYCWLFERKAMVYVAGPLFPPALSNFPLSTDSLNVLKEPERSKA